MRRQEETAYRCSDYLSLASSSPSPSAPSPPASPRLEDVEESGVGREERRDASSPPPDPPIDEDCRVKMTEWCVQVVDFCKFSRETVTVALGYLDRFLSNAAAMAAAAAAEAEAEAEAAAPSSVSELKGPPPPPGSELELSDAPLSEPAPESRALLALTDRREYQLAAMTSLLIAIKLNEPLEMEVTLLSDISRGCYPPSEISRMERDMLDVLGWRLSGPTALGFAVHFLALLPDDLGGEDSMVPAVLRDFCRYQTELAAADYHFVTQNTSTVALASLLNSMEAIDYGSFTSSRRDAFLDSVARASGLRVDSPEVRDARSRLMRSFRRSSGYELGHVASRLAAGAKGGDMSKGGGGEGEGGSSDESLMEDSPNCVTKRRRFSGH